MISNEKVSVLFVCLGNICRSPTAQGVFEHRLGKAGLDELIATDSAGTGSWHIGKAPDERARLAALKRGIDIGHLRARQVSPADFDSHDYILAMDESNLADLEAMRPPDYRGTLDLFLNFGNDPGQREVPDPYYGGDQGFERVLDLIETAADNLIAHIRQQHLEP